MPPVLKADLWPFVRREGSLAYHQAATVVYARCNASCTQPTSLGVGTTL
jgi:hypothetical protein